MAENSARTLLQVSGLRKTYRTGKAEVIAVDGLSFSLRGLRGPRHRG